MARRHRSGDMLESPEAGTEDAATHHWLGGGCLSPTAHRNLIGSAACGWRRLNRGSSGAGDSDDRESGSAQQRLETGEEREHVQQRDCDRVGSRVSRAGVYCCRDEKESGSRTSGQSADGGASGDASIASQEDRDANVRPHRGGGRARGVQGAGRALTAAPRLLALAVLALALQSASCFEVQSPVVIIDEDSACVKASSSADPCDASTALLHAYPGFASALGSATLAIIATVSALLLYYSRA